MILTIKTVTQEQGDYGQYRKVVGIDADGKEVTKNVGDKFQDKWPLLQENATVEFKVVQRNNKWFIADIIPVALPEATVPYTAPPALPTSNDGKPSEPTAKPEIKPSPQEVGLFYKELGLWLREDKLDMTKPINKALNTKYWIQLLLAVGVKTEKKEG